jgi:hypothetical protein
MIQIKCILLIKLLYAFPRTTWEQEKSDHRMQRNYLKGFIGDQINLLMAAVAFNLKKWMNNFFTVLFYTEFYFLVLLYAK